jgi:glutathione S-transferase
MDSTTNGAALVECVVPLDEEGRRAVRRYWEQVIREEWEPPVRRVPRAVPLPEDGRRERREARRAIARIAAASRVATAVLVSGSAGVAA